MLLLDLKFRVLLALFLLTLSSCALTPRSAVPKHVEPYAVVNPATPLTGESLAVEDKEPALQQEKLADVPESTSEVLNADQLNSTPPMKPSPFGSIPLLSLIHI